MKKIKTWWKKKTTKEKIFFVLLCLGGYLFLVWKNIIPYKIETLRIISTSNGSVESTTETWYWLGKEL